MIKFSELRGLIKETNLNIVKMSDPAYGIIMEKITHKENYVYTDNEKLITFNELHNLKINNKLFLLQKINPFYFRIHLFYYPNVIINSSLLIKKQNLYQYFLNGIKDIKNYVDEQQIKDGLYSHFYINNNTNIKNPYLHYLLYNYYTGEDDRNLIINLQRYKNSKLEYIKHTDIFYSKNDNSQKFCFYNNLIVDNDVGIKSSILLNTQKFSNNKYLSLDLYYGYKPNDMFKTRYKTIQLYLSAVLNSKGYATNKQYDIFNGFVNQKSENPSVDIYDTVFIF